MRNVIIVLTTVHFAIVLLLSEKEVHFDIFLWKDFPQFPWEHKEVPLASYVLRFEFGLAKNHYAHL